MTGQDFKDYVKGFESKLDVAFSKLDNGWQNDAILNKLYNEILEAHKALTLALWEQ